MVDYLVGPALSNYHKVVAHKVRGQTLWAVIEYTQDAGMRKAGHRFIACFLMRSYRGEGWGYKDLDESMGPTEVSCPMKYLAMVPDPGGYATAWRERVRAAASQVSVKAKLKASIRPGNTLVMVQGCRPAKLQVLSTSPLVGQDENGTRYKIQPRHIDHIEP